MSTETNSALDAYLSFDLTRDGNTANLLLSRVDEEARSDQISLSGPGDEGTPCAGLTPAMIEWYGGHVAPNRSVALAQLSAIAREIKINSNVEGFVLEIEEDKIEREKARRTHEVLDDFNRDNKTLLEKVKTLRREHDLLRGQLANRAAKTPNLSLEFGILLPAIMIPEALLNFESFRRAPIIQSDAMALGATILVGLGIAAASYCWGLYIRQFEYFTRPDTPDRVFKGWPLYSWGSTLLTISLASAAVARYYFLQPKIQEAEILGNPIPNVAVSVGGLLFGNLICFFLGAIITFFLNDPNPEYADKAQELKKAEKKLAGLRKGATFKRLNEVNLRARQDLANLRQRATQMSGSSSYNALRDQVTKVLAKDQAVVAILQAYRGDLVRKIRSIRPKFFFQMNEQSQDRLESQFDLSIEKYSAQPIKLSRHV